MTRSLEEIKIELRARAAKGDFDGLAELADELQLIGSIEAEAAEASTRAVVARARGNAEAAIEFTKRSMHLYEQSGDLLRAAHAANNVGITLRSIGNHPEALEFYHRALGMYTDIDEKQSMALVTNNIGNIYHAAGYYPAALEHYHRALSLQEEVGDKSGAALVVGNIGVVHRATGSLDLALQNYRQALKTYEEIDDQLGVAMIYGNIGIVLADKGDQEGALRQYECALKIRRELDDHDGVNRVMGNVGHVLIDAGRVEEVREILTTYNAEEIGDPGVRIDRDRLNARILEHDGDFDRAEAMYREALREVTEHGLRSQEVNLHLALRDLALKKDDLKMYIEHNKLYLKINDDIQGKEASMKVVMQVKQREIQAMQRERERERAVLYSTLPKHVADRVIKGERATDQYDAASVLFLDLVSFTAISDKIPAAHVIGLLQEIFKVCDTVCATYGLTKIKTMGDSYLAVSGVPEAIPDHADRAARAALEMRQALKDLSIKVDPSLGDTSWTKDVGDIEIRIGLHSGPLVAGIVGTDRLQYDIWGDTVNTASRMESNSLPGRIQISDHFRHDLTTPFTVEERGEIPIKGKGLMRTFWLG